MTDGGDAALERYLALCRRHQVVPSADALISLQLGTQDLVVRPSDGRPFGDLDLRALVMLLEDDHGAKLEGLRSLDFSACSLGPSGALLVADLLRHPACHIEVLDLSHQWIGRRGVSTIMQAVHNASSLRNLSLAFCSLGDSSETVLEYLRSDPKVKLKEVDLQNNLIGFELCSALFSAARAADVKIWLLGNRMLDEVLNACSHGLGAVLTIVGTFFLFWKIRRRPPHYHVCCGLYGASVFVLFLFSTLFHSFYALGRTTRLVFGTLDYSSCFVMIAGSYTPVMGILFHDTWWGRPMLVTVWLAAIIGISTAAFYRGPGDQALRTTMYMVMGWSVLLGVRPMVMKLGCKGTTLMLSSGALGSAGVPFLIRNEHVGVIPDHTIWHLLVVCGAAAHYASVWLIVSKAGAPLSCEQKLDGDSELKVMDLDELSQAHYEQLPNQPL